MFKDILLKAFVALKTKTPSLFCVSFVLAVFSAFIMDMGWVSPIWQSLCFAWLIASQALCFAACFSVMQNKRKDIPSVLSTAFVVAFMRLPKVLAAFFALVAYVTIIPLVIGALLNVSFYLLTPSMYIPSKILEVSMWLYLAFAFILVPRLLPAPAMAFNGSWDTVNRIIVESFHITKRRYWQCLLVTATGLALSWGAAFILIFIMFFPALMLKLTPPPFAGLLLLYFNIFFPLTIAGVFSYSAYEYLKPFEEAEEGKESQA